MTYRKLDSNGDFSFGRGSQDFLSGAYAVAQAVKTKLLLLFAEWWEDTSDGTPLFQNIIGVPGTPDFLQAADLTIQERIIATTDVTNISEFNSNYSNRTLSVSCAIDTTYGTTTVEVTF